MKTQIKSFFDWYERHYLLNISIAGGLFLLQLVHLYWLATDVIAFKLFEKSFFHLTGFWYYLILIVDYTEIPALISAGLIYVNELRKGYSLKSLLFIILLASQLLHIFWITDEFVVESFTSNSTPIIGLSGWLAWIAILIDYGEVPVIYDTLKRVWDAVKKGDLAQAGKALKN